MKRGGLLAMLVVVASSAGGCGPRTHGGAARYESPCGEGLAAGRRQRAAQMIQTTHWGRVVRMRFAPGGRLLATASDDGSVRVWDVPRRRVLRVFPVDGQVYALEWDGEEALLVGRAGRHPALIDVFAGKAIAELGQVALVAPHPTRGGEARWLGVAIAGDGYDAELGIYDRRGEKIARLQEICGGRDAWFAEGGTALAQRCVDDVQILTADRGGIFSARTVQGRPGDNVVVDPRGRAIFWTSWGWGDEERPPGSPAVPSGVHAAWGPDPAVELPGVAGTEGTPRALALSPDGELLVAALQDRTTYATHLVAWKTADRTLAWSQREAGGTALAFAPDGRHLAVGREDGSILLHEAGGGGRIAALGSSVRRPMSIAFAPGEVVVTSQLQETRWSLARPGLLARRHLGDDERQKRIAALQQVYMERYRAGPPPAPAGTPADLGEVSAQAQAPDQGLVLAASAGGDLVVVRDGVVEARGQSDGGRILDIVLSPDRRLAITTSIDGIVRLWDVETALVRALFVDFDDEEWMVATPGGAYVGTPEVGTRIGWVFDDPVEFFSFEQFAASFDDPALVVRRMRGAAVEADLDIARPPRVDITSPDRVAHGGRGWVTVRVSSDRRVDTVRAFVEGRLVHTRKVCAARGTIDLEVPVVAGSNHVSVVAFDDLGHASNDAAATITSATGAAADLWVVSVGVSDYPHLLDQVDLPPSRRAASLEALQLPAAREDARGLARALSSLRRDYDRVHVTTLVDAQATPDAIRGALDRLAAMRPDDLAVVLLAGHGLKPSAGGDMVFITGGAAFAPDGKRLSRASIDRDAVSWGDISAALARARGRVMVLLDACHAGHISRELVAPNDALATRLVRDGRAGAIVFAAAKGRQESFEPRSARGLFHVAAGAGAAAAAVPATQLRAAAPPEAAQPLHGFFTRALLESLDDPATDRDGDGAIEASEWIEEVTRRVSEQTGDRQTPWVARRDLFGDFRLRTVPAAAAH
ncbi:MAG TPA: caspase family protein [Kofleriaceae bacterium]|nr:caspase family protein [Kofleriaceae bacterium]